MDLVVSNHKFFTHVTCPYPLLLLFEKLPDTLNDIHMTSDVVIHIPPAVLVPERIDEDDGIDQAYLLPDNDIDVSLL